MAKMFYSLEEAAEKLGVSPDQVRDMAAEGKLQQFRDRDRLMFKRDQIEQLAGGGGEAPPSSQAPSASDSSADAIDLSAAEEEQPPRPEDARQATGISVFDAGEIELADPMAQTQITDTVADDDQLALDSVGSGSGLLDLTRESDDTSLGAELLDEIYPGGETGQDSAMGGSGLGGSALGASAFGSAMGSPSGSGVFDTGFQMEPGGSGLENAQGQAPPAMPAMPMADVEESDPAGSGMSAGMLFGAMIALVLASFVIASLVMGKSITLTQALAGEPGSNSVLLYSGLLLVLTLILGGVGYMVGKSRG